jgi:hypothetical protein
MAYSAPQNDRKDDEPTEVVLSIGGSVFIAHDLLVVHGQQHEYVSGAKLDSKNGRAYRLLRPGGDKGFTAC